MSATTTTSSGTALPPPSGTLMDVILRLEESNRILGRLDKKGGPGGTMGPGQKGTMGSSIKKSMLGGLLGLSAGALATALRGEFSSKKLFGGIKQALGGKSFLSMLIPKPVRNIAKEIGDFSSAVKGGYQEAFASKPKKLQGSIEKTADSTSKVARILEEDQEAKKNSRLRDEENRRELQMTLEGILDNTDPKNRTPSAVRYETGEGEGKGLIGIIGSILGGAFKAFQEFISGMWKTISSFTSGLWGAIRSFLQTQTLLRAIGAARGSGPLVGGPAAAGKKGKTAGGTLAKGAAAAGRMGKIGKFLGIGGVVGAGAASAIDTASKVSELEAMRDAGDLTPEEFEVEKAKAIKQGVGGGIGGMAGAATGAALGAKIGAIGGPIGIPVGALVGGIAGGIIGEYSGRKVADSIPTASEMTSKASAVLGSSPAAGAAALGFAKTGSAARILPAGSPNEIAESVVSGLGLTAGSAATAGLMSTMTGIPSNLLTPSQPRRDVTGALAEPAGDTASSRILMGMTELGELQSVLSLMPGEGGSAGGGGSNTATTINSPVNSVTVNSLNMPDRTGAMTQSSWAY